ncbi:MAG: RNase adapter RapZ [Ruminococcaceae bacterium]|nr:RNase adapter RapZ [Oscillospiraceae bacterium]
MKIVIISGMSGAGKSSAIKAMEDAGFYCVDNMPPKLIPAFAEVCGQSNGEIEKVGLVVDMRSGNMFNQLPDVLEKLRAKSIDYDILFLEASDEVLVSRYKQTRRSHPLAPDGGVSEGIAKERKLLESIRKSAEYIIDTSSLTTLQLKEEVNKIFLKGSEYKSMVIKIESFGFKHGIPYDADLVFDVRFLPNPFYIPELKAKTGLNHEVSSYVFSFKQTGVFVKQLEEMISFLIPHYMEEGKTELVIGIGCTGGKHRSVAIAEELYKYISKTDYRTVIKHRDYLKE